MKPSNTTTSGKSTDIIAGICTFPRLRSPSQKWHVMLNLTSTWMCNTNFKTWMRGWGAVWSGIVFKDAAVVSAVVLRRPTKEHTHPYSMMHRRSAYCRYWGLASLSPITSTNVSDVPRTLQCWVSTIQTVVLTADVFQLLSNVWDMLHHILSRAGVIIECDIHHTHTCYQD